MLTTQNRTANGRGFANLAITRTSGPPAVMATPPKRVAVSFLIATRSEGFELMLVGWPPGDPLTRVSA